MLPAIPLLPIVAGLLIVGHGWGPARMARKHDRVLWGAVSIASLCAALALLLHEPVGSSLTVQWGAGSRLELELTAMVRIAGVLVVAIGFPVVLWAAAHESRDGLHRLLGGLTAFVGVMVLLVLAADLLTLAIAWELVGALSWMLIAHRHDNDHVVSSADYAFDVTRLGGLGLLVAAGAAIASTGSLSFASLPQTAAGSWGSLLALGILLAAATKSAQLPFSPWLFRAMEGPSSVSALLHSSTMVAAGAWLLLRLEPALEAVPWFSGACLALGLGTALVAGVAACMQRRAKRLLAASTSAHFGLAIAAVGAGFSAAAMTHLVAHAAFKALLFLVAGTVMTAAGTGRLHALGLGRRLPFIAVVSGVGVLALAGVPPLGAAWSKEQIVGATASVWGPLGIVTVIVASLSTWYAVKFQRLVFARTPGTDRDTTPSSDWAVRLAVSILALYTLSLSALWLPVASPWAASVLDRSLAPTKTWELAASVLSIVIVAAAAWVAYGRRLETTKRWEAQRSELVERWFGLSWGLQHIVAGPAGGVARRCAAFDDQVVAAGVRAAAAFGARISRLGSTVIEVGLDGSVKLLAGSAQRVAILGRRGDDHVLDRTVEWLASAARRGAGLGRRGDDRVVDRGPEGLAAGIGWSGRRAAAVQTGSVPTYYVILIGSILAFALLLGAWR